MSKPSTAKTKRRAKRKAKRGKRNHVRSGWSVTAAKIAVVGCLLAAPGPS